MQQEVLQFSPRRKARKEQQKNLSALARNDMTKSNRHIRLQSRILRHMISQIRKSLAAHSEVAFSYVHGSILDSDSPGDLDIAVFIQPDIYEKLASIGEINIGFAIPLEMELEKVLGIKVDIQVVNAAPLSFRHRVVQRGVLVVDNDPDTRCDFEYLARYQYFDFRPRREEYLGEVLA